MAREHDEDNWSAVDTKLEEYYENLGPEIADKV